MIGLQLGRVAALFILVAMAACASPDGSAKRAQDGGCLAPDHVNSVSGGGECLAIKAFVEAGKEYRDPTLVVFLHGDRSDGGRINWEFGVGANLSAENVISVVMLRPGYPGDQGRQSSGSPIRGRRTYTSHNIDAVADAIASLKQHYRASKVVLAGFSGGAAYAGVIAGRHPQLLDGITLIACPCDLPAWESYHGWSPATESLSPHRYVDGIAAGLVVVAVTGENDMNTIPGLATHYVKQAQTRAAHAEFRLAKLQAHDGIGRSDAALAAIKDTISLVMQGSNGVRAEAAPTTKDNAARLEEWEQLTPEFDRGEKDEGPCGSQGGVTLLVFCGDGPARSRK